MTYTSIRRKIATLIAARAVIGTVLLGTGTIAEITAPGSFPIDPFFFQIAVIYALTIVWAAPLRQVDRHLWLVDLQLALDALLVTSFIYVTGGITSYFTSRLSAADHRRERRAASSRRHVRRDAERGALCRPRVAQYFAASGILHDPWLATERLVLPSHSRGAVHGRAECLRVLRGRDAERIALRERPFGWRPSRDRLAAGSPT